MTIPEERYQALANVRPALLKLLNQPGPIRKRDLANVVASLLRHYPSTYELDVIAQRCPSLLRDPVYYARNRSA